MWCVYVPMCCASLRSPLSSLFSEPINGVVVYHGRAPACTRANHYYNTHDPHSPNSGLDSGRATHILQLHRNRSSRFGAFSRCAALCMHAASRGAAFSLVVDVGFETRCFLQNMPRLMSFVLIPSELELYLAGFVL